MPKIEKMMKERKKFPTGWSANNILFNFYLWSISFICFYWKTGFYFLCGFLWHKKMWAIYTWSINNRELSKLLLTSGGIWVVITFEPSLFLEIPTLEEMSMISRGFEMIFMVIFLKVLQTCNKRKIVLKSLLLEGTSP